MTKLSRTKIDLSIECPRCFWLDMKHGIKRPPPAPYTINNAIDYLLKQEFDLHREKGTPHPIMVENNVNAVPYEAPEMSKWRHNFTGVQYEDKKNDFLVYGAVDDVWKTPEGELIIVDYKATGAINHQIYDSYKRQMEIYQWLVRRNGHKVSSFGYFVFAKVSKEDGFGFGKARLPFNIFVEVYKGDDSWVDGAIQNARKLYDLEKPPAANPECAYCEYRRGAGEVLISPDLIQQ